MAPRLVIAAASQSFDQVVISHWQEEGFEVRFEPVRDGTSASIRSIESIGDSLDTGEKYAIILQLLRPRAYACKFIFHQASLLHQNISATLTPSTSPGFAQRESGCFDKTASGLAWSRCLDCVRKGFGIEVDLESVWEKHQEFEFTTKNPSATLKTVTSDFYVNHVPTLTGGVGAQQLLRFYRDFFIPCNPRSFSSKLLSRTIGSDRIVDEMLISFTHTCEIPWILPGVPPTGKKVEVVLIGVVCIRGGMLYHEQLHWDQASVLVQVGLLDAKLGAVGLGKNGVRRLPISGVEAARKAVDETSMESNKLIPNW